MMPGPIQQKDIGERTGVDRVTCRVFQIKGLAFPLTQNYPVSSLKSRPQNAVPRRPVLTVKQLHKGVVVSQNCL